MDFNLTNDSHFKVIKQNNPTFMKGHSLVEANVKKISVHSC